MEIPPAKKVLEALVLVEWTAVAAYFVKRFIEHRKLVSLAIAAMALGWSTVGLMSGPFLGADLWIDLVALSLGIVVWTTIIQVERTGR